MEFDEDKWRQLLEMLDDYPAIKRMLVSYEHYIWLFGFMRVLAKWLTAVGAGVVLIQSAWNQIINWMHQ